MINLKKKPIENQLIFLMAFILNLIVAYFLVFKSGYIADEAIIRTGQALDLIQGYDRGRQSLVCSVWWSPLPTLIQLPLVFFKFHLHKLFLNNIISGISGAISLVFLNRLFKRCGFRPVYRYPVLGIFQFNPLILFYSANGTSHMIFVLFLAASLYYFLRWFKGKGLRDFLLMTLNTSLLCLIRVEGVFYAIAILVILIITSFYQKYRTSRREGFLLLYLSPVVYLIFLWGLFNWLIMGDWFYFLRGTFLNSIRLECSPHLVMAQPFQLIKEEMNRVDRERQEIAEISSYLAKYKQDSQIMVTDFRGYLFRYYSGEIYFLTHCFDFSFQKIPPGDAPLYLLISRPGGKAGIDGIHWRYPRLYGEGTRFTILDQDFDSWRVFRVIQVNPLEGIYSFDKTNSAWNVYF